MIRDWADRTLNFSGGSMVGLATLTILGLAVAEYASGTPTYIMGPDGKNIIYIVHRAPEWFTSQIGIYSIILGMFAASKPINTLITQKGQAAGTTPPDEAKK